MAEEHQRAVLAGVGDPANDDRYNRRPAANTPATADTALNQSLSHHFPTSECLVPVDYLIPLLFLVRFIAGSMPKSSVGRPMAANVARFGRA